MYFEKMKDIRTYFDVSQEMVAESLGVKRSTYAGWENGFGSIKLLYLNDFCNYFGVSIDYICELNKNKKYPITSENIDIIALGKKLREVRKINNDSQKEVSKIINVDRSNLSRYEKGESIISVDSLIRFAKNYNVSIDWLCNRIKSNKA